MYKEKFKNEPIQQGAFGIRDNSGIYVSNRNYGLKPSEFGLVRNNYSEEDKGFIELNSFLEKEYFELVKERDSLSNSINATSIAISKIRENDRKTSTSLPVDTVSCNLLLSGNNAIS